MMQHRQPVRAIMKINFQQDKNQGGGEGNQQERPSSEEVQAGGGRKRSITGRMGRPRRKNLYGGRKAPLLHRPACGRPFLATR